VPPRCAAPFEKETWSPGRGGGLQAAVRAKGSKEYFGLEAKATFANEVLGKSRPQEALAPFGKESSGYWGFVRHCVGKSCPALSSEPGLILLTAQVVRGSVGSPRVDGGRSCSMASIRLGSPSGVKCQSSTTSFSHCQGGLESTSGRDISDQVKDILGRGGAEQTFRHD